MAKKFALRVEKAENCPLYLGGERMVLALPEVLKQNSDRICVLALSKLIPLCQEKLKNKPRLANVSLHESCPGCNGGTAQFTLEPIKLGVTQQLSRLVTQHSFENDAPAPHEPILGQLPNDVVKQLLNNCQVRRYHEPTVIVREGEVGRYFHILGAGEAEVVKNAGKDGDEIFIARLVKGDGFGEMSLFTGESASATVRTVGDDAAILSCDKETLDNMIAKLPPLAQAFSKIMSKRLQDTTKDLQDERAHDMAGRLSENLQLGNVIQTLNQNQQSGTLVLEDRYKQQKGTLVFHNGEVIDAFVDETGGEEAVYKLMCWSAGSFTFRSDDARDQKKTITCKTTMLMMEGMRRIDEANR